MNMTTVPSNQLKAMQQEIADLKETIAQQAEAIRVKDAALIAVRDDLELRMQIAEEESLNISNSVLDQMCDAIDIQSSPEILQARDERVAEACAKIVNPSSLTYITRGDALTAIRSNEWRKYL